MLNGMLRTLVVAAMSMAMFPQHAAACSQVVYADNGRYVGGDLAAQIADKADTIQLVRATGRHLYRRTCSEGEWYFQFGQTDVPGNRPEFVNEYVYEFSVVETLKGAAQAGSEYYEHHPRILAYDAGEWRDFLQHGAVESDHVAFNTLPNWLTEEPGNNGRAFTGGAQEGAGLGSGQCNGPYLIEVGETFVVFRDSMGRFYPSGMMATNALSIDAEFRTERGRRERTSFNMQTLVPSTSNDDSFLARLRSALHTN